MKDQKWHRRTRFGVFSVLAVSSVALLGHLSTSRAASSTWTGNAGDSLFSDAGNWNNGIPGATSGFTNTDTATFSTLTGATVTVDPSRNLENITFDQDVGAFTLTSGTDSGTFRFTTGGTLQLASTVTSAGETETISTPITVGTTSASVYTIANNSTTTDLLSISGSYTPAATAAVSSGLTLGATNTTANIFSGAINQAASSSGTTLTKTGLGTWILSGANTFTGTTAVQAGILNYQNSTAFATNSAISVSSGATLQVQGGIAGGSKAISLSGFGAAGTTGALENVSGNNSYAGIITTGSPGTSISSDAGTLTLTGNIVNSFGGVVVEFNGAGMGVDNGLIGTSAATVAVNKNGAGTWTLGGTVSNSTNSTNVIIEGTLGLNFAASTAPATNILSGTGLLKTGGGTLVLTGASGVTNSQTLGAFSLGTNSTGSGSTAIVFNQNGATSLSLTVASLNPSLNSTLDITLPTAGAVTSTAQPAVAGNTSNPILNANSGNYATVNGGADWAALSSTVAGTTYTITSPYTVVPGSTVPGFYTANTATTLGTTQNVDMASGVNTNLTAASTKVVSLRFNNANQSQTISAASTSDVLSTSGVLITPTVNTGLSTISASIQSNDSTSGGELVIQQYNTGNALVLSGVIAPGGSAYSLVKAGPGTLDITNANNTYTGPTELFGGVTNIVADTSLGVAPTTVTTATAVQLVLAGGTLQMGAPNITLATDRGIQIGQDGGAIDTNGYNASYGGIINSYSLSANVQNFGIFSKVGAGTLTLSGANTLTNAIAITGGTLNLALAGTNSGTAVTGGTLTTANPIAVSTGGTLLLSASDAISPGSKVTLSGGTFSVANSVVQGQGATVSGGTVSGTTVPGVGMLTLTANSTVSFTGASGTLVLSGFQPTTGANTFTLNVTGSNFATLGGSSSDGSTDRLIVFGDQTANLSDYTFNGVSDATEFSLGGGYYEIEIAAVPEPSTIWASVLCFGVLMFDVRRRVRRSGRTSRVVSAM